MVKANLDVAELKAFATMKTYVQEAEMKEPIYYQETIISKLNATIFAVIVGWLLIMLLYDPLGTRPEPDTFLIAMILLFLSLGLNFSTFRVTLHYEGLLVGYGLFKHSIPWEKIIGCYRDKSSSILYGGWGIRFGRIAGKWRLIHNVIGVPRVVVELKEGWYREFVFSTRNPEKVIEIINHRKKGI